MKLTKKEKEKILSLGFEETDLQQIEEVQNAIKLTDEKDKIISKEKAISMIGITEYLSGLSRAAFHWSSLRETEDKKHFVYFDAHKYFRS